MFKKIFIKRNKLFHLSTFITFAILSSLQFTVYDLNLNLVMVKTSQVMIKTVFC